MMHKKGQFKIQQAEKRLLKLKKAQFKIQQMAFMILAVTIFFILAGLFYLSIYIQGVAEKANEQRERRAVINAEFFAETPELTCGSYCIDTDRLMILKNRSVYKDFWPYSSIEIRRVVPRGTGRECTFGSYPDCDAYTLFDKKVRNTRRVSNFVALCRKELFQGFIAKKCELGKIVLGVEIKSIGG